MSVTHAAGGAKRGRQHVRQRRAAHWKAVRASQNRSYADCMRCTRRRPSESERSCGRRRWGNEIKSQSRRRRAGLAVIARRTWCGSDEVGGSGGSSPAAGSAHRHKEKTARLARGLRSVRRVPSLNVVRMTKSHLSLYVYLIGVGGGRIRSSSRGHCSVATAPSQLPRQLSRGLSGLAAHNRTAQPRIHRRYIQSPSIANTRAF